MVGDWGWIGRLLAGVGGVGKINPNFIWGGGVPEKRGRVYGEKKLGGVGRLNPEKIHIFLNARYIRASSGENHI